MLTFVFRCVMIIVLGRSVLERLFLFWAIKKSCRSSGAYSPRPGSGSGTPTAERSMPVPYICVQKLRPPPMYDHTCSARLSIRTICDSLLVGVADTHSLRQLTIRILPGFDHTCLARLPTRTICDRLSVATRHRK